MSDANGATGVAIFLVQDGGLLLYLRDANPDIPNPLRWSFPDGAIQPGEYLRDAAQGCLERKFGIPREILRLEYLYTTPGGNALFAGSLKKMSLPKLRPGEGLAVGLFTLKACDEYVARNKGEPLSVVNAVQTYRERYLGWICD